jgi:hypothetical protein
MVFGVIPQKPSVLSFTVKICPISYDGTDCTGIHEANNLESHAVLYDPPPVYRQGTQAVTTFHTSFLIATALFDEPSQVRQIFSHRPISKYLTLY